jgi:hypothetical protein
MIKTVTNVNASLAMKDDDLKRQAIMDELDQLKATIYERAGDRMTPKDAGQILAIITQQIRLQGLAVADKQVVDVNVNISEAKQVLDDKVKSFIKAQTVIEAEFTEVPSA